MICMMYLSKEQLYKGNLEIVYLKFYKSNKEFYTTVFVESFGSQNLHSPLF